MINLILFAGVYSTFIILQETPQPPLVYNDHTAEVTSLLFSLDGKTLHSTSLKEDRIWSVERGETLGNITNSRGHSVAMSPDGKHLAVAGFKSTSLYDASSLQKIWSVDVDRPHYSLPFMLHLVFSPDGKTLATSGSSSKVGGRHGLKAGIIKILDTKSGEEVRVFEGLSTIAETIAFSPDGRLFAAGTEGAGGELPEPGELLVWDLQTGMLKHRLKHVKEIEPGQNRCSVSGIAYHPKGTEIAIASSDGTVRVWGLKTETLRLTLTGHERPVRRVAYSPDGKHLTSAGQDHTLKLWNAEEGALAQSLTIDCPKVNVIVFSPDGQRLAAGGGDFLRSGMVKLWKFPVAQE